MTSFATPSKTGDTSSPVVLTLNSTTVGGVAFFYFRRVGGQPTARRTGSARQAVLVLEDFNALRAAGEEWSQPMDVLGDHAPIEQLLALARARARRGEGNLAAMIRKLERLPTEGS